MLANNVTDVTDDDVLFVSFLQFLKKPKQKVMKRNTVTTDGVWKAAAIVKS